MNFQEFRGKWFDLACISSRQVYAWQPGFDKNNLSRWSEKGLLIKLRNGFYTFPEYKTRPGFELYLANRIYRPSYISLHTALAFYGMIPESVIQITSVTSLKTAQFMNVFGEFSYKSLRPDLMFGYDTKPLPEGGSLLLAKPEKALLDLLYLYPFYNTEKEIEELRLDDHFMRNELNTELLEDFLWRFQCKALSARIKFAFH
jgi:predicted transcriptional regulator of viral defense system